MPAEDEFTPRDRGLVIGHLWASHQARIDGPVGEVAEGNIADEVRQVISTPELRERLDASSEDDAEDAFWRGFISGARAFVVEVRTGTDN